LTAAPFAKVETLQLYLSTLFTTEIRMDYEYEQVEENGEDAVGPRRRPKKLEN
jgi:hypothetical protein